MIKKWCLQQSDEARNYGDRSLIEPWEGIVTQDDFMRYSKVVQIHHFNKETGEIDFDSNATVTEPILFDTFEEAAKYYARHKIEELKEKHRSACKEFSDLMKFITKHNLI